MTFNLYMIRFYPLLQQVAGEAGIQMTSTVIYVAQQRGELMVTYKREENHVTCIFTAYGFFMRSNWWIKIYLLPIYLVFHLPTSVIPFLRWVHEEVNVYQIARILFYFGCIYAILSLGHSTSSKHPLETIHIKPTTTTK